MVRLDERWCTQGCRAGIHRDGTSGRRQHSEGSYRAAAAGPGRLEEDVAWIVRLRGDQVAQVHPGTSLAVGAARASPGFDPRAATRAIAGSAAACIRRGRLSAAVARAAHRRFCPHLSRRLQQPAARAASPRASSERAWPWIPASPRRPARCRCPRLPALRGSWCRLRPCPAIGRDVHSNPHTTGAVRHAD